MSRWVVPARSPPRWKRAGPETRCKSGCGGRGPSGGEETESDTVFGQRFGDVNMLSGSIKASIWMQDWKEIYWKNTLIFSLSLISTLSLGVSQDAAVSFGLIGPKAHFVGKLWLKIHKMLKKHFQDASLSENMLESVFEDITFTWTLLHSVFIWRNKTNRRPEWQHERFITLPAHPSPIIFFVISFLPVCLRQQMLSETQWKGWYCSWILKPTGR